MEWGWTKIAQYESHDKKIPQKLTQHPRIGHIFLIKMFLCQHNQLHLLTARIGKRIRETIYRDIEK